MSTVLWVVYRVDAYEGCGEPAGVYSAERLAKEARDTMEAGNDEIRVEAFDLDAPPRPFR